MSRNTLGPHGHRLRNSARALVLACALGIATFVFASQAGGHSKRTYGLMDPKVALGVVPKLRAADVEKKVLDALGPQSSLKSVAVLPSRMDVSSAVPGFGEPEGPQIENLTPVWVVRAYGLFRPVTTAPGADEVTEPRAGYVVIDDGSAQVLGYGWP